MPEMHGAIILACESIEDDPSILISRRPLHKPLQSFIHVRVTDVKGTLQADISMTVGKASKLEN